MANPDKDDDLEDFFNSGVERIEALDKQLKKDAEKKPVKKVEVSEDDRILYDVLGAYAGKRAAQSMDRAVSRPPNPAAAPRVPPAPRIEPTMSPAPQPPPGAQPQGMPRPVAGGPAGPVSAGPVSPLNQMSGSGVFNYGKKFDLTDIEAGRALDMTKKPGGVHDLTTQRREALNRIQSMGGGYVENPRYGGIMTPEQSVGSGPRASFVQQPAVPPAPDLPGGRPAGLAPLPPPQPVSAIPPAPLAPTAPPAPPKPGALSAALSGGKAILNAPGVSGALGGLGAAESGQEFMKRRSEGDVPGQFMAGMGVAGGMAAMAPHPLAKILGGALSAASPLSLYLYDKIKNSSQPQVRIPEPGTNLPPTEFLPIPR